MAAAADPFGTFILWVGAPLAVCGLTVFIVVLAWVIISGLRGRDW